MAEEHGAKLVKTLIAGRLEQVGGFSDDPRLPPAEDWDLWLRCADLVSIHLASEPLVEYRLHGTGASRNARRMNRARSLVLERALRLGSARSLTRSEIRHVQSQVSSTNGWDAGRNGLIGEALWWYARAIAYEPFSRTPYLGLLRSVFRR